MKKRTIIYILLTLIFILSVTGCGQNQQKSDIKDRLNTSNDKVKSGENPNPTASLEVNTDKVNDKSDITSNPTPTDTEDIDLSWLSMFDSSNYEKQTLSKEIYMESSTDYESAYQGETESYKSNMTGKTIYSGNITYMETANYDTAERYTIWIDAEAKKQWIISENDGLILCTGLEPDDEIKPLDAVTKKFFSEDEIKLLKTVKDAIQINKDEKWTTISMNIPLNNIYPKKTYKEATNSLPSGNSNDPEWKALADKKILEYGLSIIMNKIYENVNIDFNATISNKDNFPREINMSVTPFEKKIDGYTEPEMPKNGKFDTEEYMEQKILYQGNGYTYKLNALSLHMNVSDYEDEPLTIPDYLAVMDIGMIATISDTEQ